MSAFHSKTELGHTGRSDIISHKTDQPVAVAQPFGSVEGTVQPGFIEVESDARPRLESARDESSLKRGIGRSSLLEAVSRPPGSSARCDVVAYFQAVDLGDEWSSIASKAL